VPSITNAQDALESFLGALESDKPPEWNQLPDIGLYMDQVINYLERQIGSLFATEKEEAITSSMINNYVKAKIIPRAKQKKYSQEHIALLLALFVLKKALTTQDMSVLLNISRSHEGNMHTSAGLSEAGDGAVKRSAASNMGADSAFYRTFYDRFRNTFLECSQSVAQEIRACFEHNKEPTAFQALALKLAVEASIRGLAAEILLSVVAQKLP